MNKKIVGGEDSNACPKRNGYRSTHTSVSIITIDPLFVLVASDDAGPQHIGMSLMVCRLRELDGANVPHDVGVRRDILLACHGLFSCSKKRGFRKKLALSKILRGIT